MKSIKDSVQMNSASFDKIDARESDYLYIDDSGIPDAGKGLYTAIPIFKHEIISMFKGKVLSQEVADQRAKAGRNQYFLSMPDGSIMDSMNSKCFARYANDAEDPIKTGSGMNSVITLDEENHVCLVAIRNIRAGEEIFCSYGKRYWKKSACLKS